MRLLLSLTILLTSCGYLSEHEAQDSESSRVERLKEKRAAELEKAERWEDGWPSKTDCDGLLWASLASAAGVTVNVGLAEYAPGKLHRRPRPPCWVEGRKDQDSRSECSRDQVTGYLWHLWKTEDLEGLTRFADFLEGNDWYCGQPETLSVTKITPNLQGLIGRMLYVLSGGKDDRDYRHLPTYYGAVDRPFERHIQTLGILLQGDVDAKLTDLSFRRRSVGDSAFRHRHFALAGFDINGQMKARLKENAEAHPKDPLFAAAHGTYTGKMKRAMDLLLGDPPRPKYVRGDRPGRFERAHRLFVMKRVLKRIGGFHGA